RKKEVVVIKRAQKKPGRTTKVSHYKFSCGVLYYLRIGRSRRDILEEYDSWHMVYTRYKRCRENGFFWHLLYQNYKALNSY
ncbi:MAG: transposase, partial [Candidatus Midichloria sp.]|nr:transposase [Candidatus Midichloria sp.]